MRWYQRFFRRGLTEKHLDVELRFHLEQQIAEYISRRAWSPRQRAGGRGWSSGDWIR